MVIIAAVVVLVVASVAVVGFVAVAVIVIDAVFVLLCFLCCRSCCCCLSFLVVAVIVGVVVLIVSVVFVVVFVVTIVVAVGVVVLVVFFCHPMGYVLYNGSISPVCLVVVFSIFNIKKISLLRHANVTLVDTSRLKSSRIVVSPPSMCYLPWPCYVGGLRVHVSSPSPLTDR